MTYCVAMVLDAGMIFASDSRTSAGVDQIAKFCKTTYDVTFPIFAKLEVNGPAADPLYQYLRTAAPGDFGGTDAAGRRRWPRPPGQRRNAGGGSNRRADQ